MFQRRNYSVQNVVQAPIFSGFLKSDQVQRIFDDADHGRISLGIFTNLTKLGLRDVKATITKTNLLSYCQNRISERLPLAFRNPEQIKSQPGGRFGPDSRQSLQRFDQILSAPGSGKRAASARKFG